MRGQSEPELRGDRVGVLLEVVEVGAAGALRVAAALAEDARVQQRRVERGIERQRALQPRLGFRGAAEAVEGDAVVIRGGRAERRLFVRVDLREILRRLRMLPEPQERDRTIEARLGQRRLQRQRALEVGECLLRVAGEEMGEALEVLDVGRRRTGALRAFELLERGVVAALKDVVDAPVAGRFRREQDREDQRDQAAPRT
jgi:hypothetical protein